MRIKCDRCGKRREQGYVLFLDGLGKHGLTDKCAEAGICNECKTKLLLPDALDLLLRRALKGGK